MNDTTATPTPPDLRAGALAWWREGTRSALLLRPRWHGLQPSPVLVALLVAVPFLMGLAIERLHVAGPAWFHEPALLSGWLASLVALWVCWWLVPARGPAADGQPPGALAVFAMMAAQAPLILLVNAAVLVPIARGLVATGHAQAIGFALAAWMLVAQLRLLDLSHRASGPVRAAGALLLIGSFTVHVMVPQRVWYPLPSGDARAAEPPALRLTQELVEQQSALLEERLSALQAGKPGVVDVFAITFAPFSDEDVFMRESAMVAGVMQQRFGTGGRTLQLVNNAKTASQLPWATPLNLQRAIRRIAERMARDEDVLFIHLTSHGAQNGRLAAEFGPLTVDSVTPQLLRQWLDEAGVRHRVVSVSACYSGSWIAPLAGPGTLVMTAADADHTSYGCGKLSELTFFGRAVFDEALRGTWSFEAAHAAARPVIQRREVEAGKTDGYSNPQISVGEAIRPQLARLERERREATP